ncbi:MAG: hypothetical protein R3B09_15900 [Nannocystaceae bacterium]
MNMTFRYPDQFLTVRHNPGGALLQSEVLGVEEDRSDRGEDRPTPFTISISITHNKLIDAAKVDGLGDMFPDGTEASFAEEKDVAERVTVAGKPGYGLLMGSHGEFERVVYATLDPIWTLAIRCDFVGEAARPKVSVSDQMTACERVISTLAIDLG